MTTSTLAGMSKKPYFKSGGRSTEFTPARQGHRRYLLDRIPVPFWAAVQEKAKREKVSLRALILRLLKDWLEG
jgi:predicted DNA-binding ribbon-helix-helix protein